MRRRGNYWWSFLLVVLTAGVMGCPEDDDDPDPEDLAISVSDQTVGADRADVVTIDEATIDLDGFALIYDDADGQPGDVIGASELIDAGTHSDFEAQLDRDVEDGETLWAVLHYDALDAGEYEDHEKQPPVTNVDGERVKDSFVVTVDELPADELALVIEDQTLSEDEANTITVQRATIDEAGFVVIYEDDDGELGEVIGASELIEEGTTSDFEVELDRDVTDGETLWGVLHYDATDAGEYEGDIATQPPATDEDGDLIRDSFVVTIDEDPPVVPDEPELTVSDQILDGDEGDLSTMIVIDEVQAIEDGWVVVHEGSCDEPGSRIGHSAIGEGTVTGVVVELEEPAADEGASRDLCAMLYEDDADTFDPDEADRALDADDEEVMTTFNVEVVEGTAAIRITIDATDPPAYMTESVEPVLFADDIDTIEEDGREPIRFQLRSDWRYEFVNLATDEHPFEFTNDEEEVLLSQDVDDDDAPLEDVDSIAWHEEDDLFRFTVSEDFRGDTGIVAELLTGSDAVSSYTSAAMPDMSGPVEYID